MTLETEITIAILNNKKYWATWIDLYNNVKIELPTPQRSGTNYQQETYARIKAREIIENNKLK